MHRLLLALAAFVFSPCLLGQNETSALAGRVTDPSGSGVPGARVQLTSQSTGSVRETAASIAGEYRLELLPPGDYSLRVTANGFKTFEDSRIHLQVAQPSQLDVPLAV